MQLLGSIILRNLMLSTDFKEIGGLCWHFYDIRDPELLQDGIFHKKRCEKLYKLADRQENLSVLY